MPLHEIPLEPLHVERYIPLVGEEAVHEALEQARRMRALAGGRVLWNVNSTGFGGGVAEMLGPLLAYARGAGIDARWVVIDAPPEFFRITKRLHNALHGEAGDRSPLGRTEQMLYEAVTRANAEEFLQHARPGDVAILHDPQTAGLAPLLLHAGLGVVWRCHIGRDSPNTEVENAWRFLLPYLAEVPLCVFTRWSYVPPELVAGRTVVIAPSIDPFSAKNVELSDETVRAILVSAGLVVDGAPGNPEFPRGDGSSGRINHCADMLGLGAPPRFSDPLVLQVSRWDHLKDPIGVMLAFARLVEENRHSDAHLMLAGPNVNSVADDPDGAHVYAEVEGRFRALSHEVRRRVHLAMLPTHDREENAALVNALQRHATVVVQKSLHEGFGLTVAEAMWKSRAVVASAVGGIQDQITDGFDGLLLHDPDDQRAFTDAVALLLRSPTLRDQLGAAAHETVRTRFLGIRHLHQFGIIVERLDAALQRESAMHM